MLLNNIGNLMGQKQFNEFANGLKSGEIYPFSDAFLNIKVIDMMLKFDEVRK